MIPRWLRGGAAALILSVLGTVAPAATITDATFDLTGNYAWDWGRYGFDGSFAGTLLGDPTVARDYDLDLAISLSGNQVLNQTVSLADLAGGVFSIGDAANGLASAPGFGGFLGILSQVTDDILAGPGEVRGDFAFRLGYLGSTALKLASCFSIFSDGCAHRGDFDIAMRLSYEGQPAPAAVALPAALPLLGAGLGALVLLRRRRR